MWRQLCDVTVILLLNINSSRARSNTSSNNEQDVLRFPDKILFGVSTSAYQIEGGWNASDKAESVIDYMLHMEPWHMPGRDNGDVSCDSFHNYKRDVQMLRELGVDFYRFSLSWSRILPTGFSNYVSKDGIAYYNGLIDELLKYNITPVVTLYHFDLPQNLQSLGGWTNPYIVTWFDDYIHIAFKYFGDRVKTWITINEPHEQCQSAYGKGLGAPFLNMSGTASYLCTHYQMKAHAVAYHTYNDTYRPKQKGRIGFTAQMKWGEPASKSADDIQGAEVYNQFRNAMYYNPICGSGDYPSLVKKKVAAKSAAQGFPRSRLPEFTKEDIQYIKGTYDFVGLNHYTTHYVYRNSSLDGMYPVPSMQDDIGVAYTFDSSWDSEILTTMKVVPWGMRKCLNFLKQICNNPEIHIYENGYGSSTGLIDNQRINFYRKYLTEVLKAVHKDRVNVTAYAAWSLMDNFEWCCGFGAKFGFYEVNFTDPLRTRTMRKSGFVYKHIIKSRSIDQDYEPDMKVEMIF